jgi:uncharacterized membrane protein
MSAPSPPSTKAPASSTELSRLSDRLGTLLQVGVVLAALLLAIGVLGTLTESGAPTLDPANLHPVRPTLTSLASGGIFAGLLVVGLVVLIATPVARVFLSLETFVRGDDGDYVRVLLAVLAILFASVLAGALL